MCDQSDPLDMTFKPILRLDQAATVSHPFICSSIKRIPLLKYPGPPQRRQITHVIFDCDGILIDSAQIYDQAISSTLNDILKTGPRYESKVFYERLCGTAEKEFYTYLYDNYVSPPGNSVDEGLKAKEVLASEIKGLDQKTRVDTGDVETKAPPSPLGQKGGKSETHRVPTMAEFIQIYEEQETRFKQSCSMEPIAGVENALDYLQHVANVPIALATNSRRDDLMEKFLESKITGIQTVRDYFVSPVKGTHQSGDEPLGAQGDGKRRWVCLDDVDGKGKPEPEIYFEAARRLGVPKDQYKSCLVFEDSWTGVQVQG